MWSPLPHRPSEDVVAAAATMSICCSNIKIRYRSNDEIKVAILAVHIDQLVSQSLHTTRNFNHGVFYLNSPITMQHMPGC